MKRTIAIGSVILAMALVLTTCGKPTDGGWGFDEELVGEWRFGAAIDDSWVYNFDTTYSNVSSGVGTVSIIKSDGTFSQITRFADGWELYCLTGKYSTKGGIIIKSFNMVKYPELPITAGKGNENPGTPWPIDNQMYYKIVQEDPDTVLYQDTVPNPGPGHYFGGKMIKQP